MKKILLFFLLSILLLPSLFTEKQVQASDKNNHQETVIYFFWGDGCPHCMEQKPWLEEMKDRFPKLKVKMLETYNNIDNVQLFKTMAESYGVQAQGVPTTFIGDFDPIVGFGAGLKHQMEEKIVYCLESGCINPGVKAGFVEKPNSESESAPDSSEKTLEEKQDKEREIELQDGSQEETDDIKDLNDQEKDTKEESTENKHGTCLHLFYKNGCPQCQKIEGFLNNLEEEYNIDINKYEASTESGSQLYQSFKDRYGLTTGAYPIIFIGDKYFIGEKLIQEELEKEIIYCQESPCPCPLENIRGFTPYLPQSKDFTPEDEEIIFLPILGEINLSAMPIYVTTFIISFIDGFNPCSLWLITFLLGIVIYSNSRKKIIAVGGTFLLVTGAAYAFFMAGLLNIFLYVGYLNWIQIIVASVALIFAIVNIKDYFWYKKGISFTISDKHKPRLFKNIRGVMKSDKSLAATIFGTTILALGVVLIELPCTAGFPLIWTNMIAQQQIQGLTFLLLLLFYITIYLLIELIIVLVAIKTMKTARFEEKHGRILKLVGGMIMLALALVMFFNPDLMNKIGTTILIFGSAIISAFLLMLIHRKLLPKLGIQIGTEEELKESKDEKLKDDSQKE